MWPTGTIGACCYCSCMLLLLMHETTVGVIHGFRIGWKLLLGPAALRGHVTSADRCSAVGCWTCCYCDACCYYGGGLRLMRLRLYAAPMRGYCYRLCMVLLLRGYAATASACRCYYGGGLLLHDAGHAATTGACCYCWCVLLLWGRAAAAGACCYYGGVQLLLVHAATMGACRYC